MSHWGIGVFNPKTAANVGILWRAAHLYGASHIFTIGERYQRQPTDTTKAWCSIPLFSFETFEDFAAHRPLDTQLVGIELSDRAVPLAEFDHPKAVTYLLGAEDRGLPEHALDACQHVVQIETVLPWSMNVAMAGSLVAYDRHVKNLARLAVAS